MVGKDSRKIEREEEMADCSDAGCFALELKDKRIREMKISENEDHVNHRQRHV